MKKRPLRIPAIVCILLFASVNGVSQGHPLRKYAVSANFHHGFIVPHRSTVEYLLRDHVNGLELDLIRQSDGSKEWERAFGLPETGLSLSVWNLGNEEELGKAVALIPYIDFPMSGRKNLTLDLRFGWGLNYVEKVFDVDDNHKNQAIGTHLNFAILIYPHLKWRLNERMAIGAGFGLTHFSNGAVTMPNLGLNLATATGSLTYSFGKALEINPLNDTTQFKTSPYWSFYGAAGFKETYPVNGKEYLAFTLFADRSFQISRKSAFGAGLDLFYDTSDKANLESSSTEPVSVAEAMKIGLHGSYELHISRISFTFNMGTYLYAKYTIAGNIYHRIGTRYRINDKLFACFNLKTHFGKADYVEWGIGYSLRKRKP